MDNLETLNQDEYPSSMSFVGNVMLISQTRNQLNHELEFGEKLLRQIFWKLVELGKSMENVRSGQKFKENDFVKSSSNYIAKRKILSWVSQIGLVKGEQSGC